MIEFGGPNTMQWDDDHQEVRFQVNADGSMIICRISHEWLETRANKPRPGDGAVRAARDHYDEIVRKLRQKYAFRTFESGGSLLLTTLD